MKVTALRDNLKEGLGIVERVVSRSTSLPILGNILFSANQNFLELAATDLEIGVRYRMLVKNEKEGQVVVPSRVLSQLAGFFPVSSVTLGSVNDHLAVSCGDYATTIKTFNADEFPLIPSLKGQEDHREVEIQEFCKGISQVAGVAGQSQSRPEISGVFLSFEKEGFRIAATDSFRLAEKTIRLGQSSGFEQSFILPQKTAREVVAIFGDKTGALKVYLSSTQVIFDYLPAEDFSQPQIQLVSRLIDGEYPNYRDIIPAEYKTKIVVQKSELLNHIKASSIFSGRTNEVRLSVAPDREGVEISARSSDIGEHTSFLGCPVQGEAVEASFNWRFLVEGLSSIRGEEIEFSFSSEEGPATIIPTSKEGFLYVVMPIRA